MSDDALNSARLHLSEAAELAKTMADGFAMKKLTRALNRCNPINVNPHSPQGYAENAFEGGNVGAPPQNPQYSVGSYDAASPLPVTEYPGDTVPPALPDPCQGMKATLQACAPPSTYCPSFMGQPTGEVRPLTGSSQPLDTYDSFTNQPRPLDPNRSLNDTLRQLWLRNAVQQSAQMPYAQGHKPKGPGGGQFTSGDGGSRDADPEIQLPKQDRRPKQPDPIARPFKTSGRPDQPGGFNDAIEAADLVGADRPGEPGYSLRAIMAQAEDRARRGKRLTPAGLNSVADSLDVVANSFYRIAEQTANDGVYGEDRAVGVSRSEAAEQASNRVRQLANRFRALANPPTQNTAYSYPQNPDGRAQGPMTAIPQGDFLGGRFGPGIKRMREQLNNCRR